MPFFDEPKSSWKREQQSRSPKDKTNKIRARRLHGILASSRKAERGSCPADWEQEFSMLNKTHTDSEVDEVLDWFDKNSMQEYTPFVHNARTFRFKFHQIRDSMKLNPVVCVEVSDLARKISSRLGGLIWPDERTKDQELKAVQVSVDNYTEWLVRLNKKFGVCNCGMLEYLLAMGGDAEVFVMNWFVDVHRLAHSWEKWNGNLMSYTITTKRKQFRKVINGWCREYRGPGDHWEFLMELMRR